MKAVYKRVVIKISGEALAAEKKTGFDFDFVSRVCEAVMDCTKMGVEVGIVIGGGNFWRGVKDGAGKVERVSADRMGMLATAMNCLAVADVFKQLGADAKVMTAVDIQGVGERYDTSRAIEYMKAGKVHADALLLAKNVDGVYSADPDKDPTAVKFDEISYSEVLLRRLAVMDSTATSLAMDNNIPVVVFALAEPTNMGRVLSGEKIGTTVK